MLCSKNANKVHLLTQNTFLKNVIHISQTFSVIFISQEYHRMVGVQPRPGLEVMSTTPLPLIGALCYDALHIIAMSFVHSFSITLTP